ncbi:MAG TPA: acetylxylan esterase [Candidatus Sulfotelmatobacter sp.]|nr:acetylxylan esterase [Candidatus Sulfotelmatobacter sp.]
MKNILIVSVCILWSVTLSGTDRPSPDALRVLPQNAVPGPSIAPYLRYQSEMAWRQDDQRCSRWASLSTERDLLQLQQEMRNHLLEMIGGLPTTKTPLNPQITGRIQMRGFHTEKLIFESRPGVYVTALVYAPEDGSKVHPAVLVPSGHAENGKLHYQTLCQHLVQRGYVVISWDAVGQGERSQFWDVKKAKSRYNLICGEHAVLGNLAYLAGTNLARWEIWDGIRALDYLLTRADVDPEHINITGTSGGGTQAAYIAALDPRIKVVIPSCYITALPMRVFNRIFQDADSDPEQDLYGMISNGIDHPGLLLMMYPRPVFVAAAVLDFFPIEGTHKTFHEVESIYSKFGHSDRIAMHEGYHGHEYSAENQEAAFQFLDHFNGMPSHRGLAPVEQLPETSLRCTHTGQVSTEFPNARSLMDLIREYYQERNKQPHANLKQLYYSDLHPDIQSWSVSEYQSPVWGLHEIRWEFMGRSNFRDVTIDRYLLRHSQFLGMPILHIYRGAGNHAILFWIGPKGKVTPQDWPEVSKYLDQGYDVVSIDPRGQGETRMLYTPGTADDPLSAQAQDDSAYVSPIGSVLADYVYNSLLTGRPYFLQMIEDVEIAARFVRDKIDRHPEFAVVGIGEAYTLASAVSETLPDMKLIPLSNAQALKWSELVNEKVDLWPVQYLLPGGAYVH